MALNFHNGTPDGFYACYLRYDPNCGSDDEGGPWSGHGWYRVDPGAAIQVNTFDVGDWHRWWGIYAISDTGRFWAGPYQMDVTVEAFNQCYGIGVTTSDPDLNRTIGFRALVLDDDYDDFTVTFNY
jgi:hypothetical protein